ncbi:aldo/keto reductase [Actinoplanes siamensis]|uniref:Oxidoreductase n=1 Tax=Actinoplanes siamensis TaxID=1223317 RepID=A0A919TJ88_9ACTN|nr:aldo/keto reductase [Actinoplanes siamensis]GIF04986.1 oxidoreductase [Actinoplanes siamensis]
MRTVPLGVTGRAVPNVVLGMMRIADRTDDEIRALVRAARDADVDFFDHAAVHGSRQHHCEERFAEALRLTPSARAEITIQTKAGIVRDGSCDSSYDHLVSSTEESLRALRTDYLDVLLLHGPDALVEPEEVARAFDDLESAGKVRAFGVCDHTPPRIELLRTAVRQPIVVNQLQLSMTHAPGVAADLAGTGHPVALDGGGVLDYCRVHRITVQAWSPFEAGFCTGTVLDSLEYADLNAVADRLGERYGVPAIAIATAWITRHPGGMQVVLATAAPERVTGAAQGSDVPLTRAEWYELSRASGHRAP